MKTQTSQICSTRAVFIAAIYLLVTSAGNLNAQVSYTTQGSTYSQNFDNLFGTVPANNTTVAASTLPTGWGFVESNANANLTLRVDNGSSGTGDTFLYGATSSNERAFGSFASGSLTSWYGVQFVNNSGSNINSFIITYDGEQWKDGGSGAAVINTLTFSYAFGASSLTNGTYFNDTALNFVALTNNTGSDVVKDGNVIHTVGITDTITGTWADGDSLWLRWGDINDPGNDDGLAIDNFSFSTPTAAPLPEPQTLAMLGLGMAALFGFSRRNRK